MTITEAPRLQLPGERHEPHVDPQRATSLIYGYEGVGKSTYAVGRDPDHTLLLVCGQSYEHLDAYPMIVNDWSEFRAIGAEIVAQQQAGECQFSHFVVDTIDYLYRLCFDHMCEQLKPEGQTTPFHPGLVNDYGRSWAMIEDEFELRIAKLCTLGGVTFISHAKDIDVSAKVGKDKKIVTTFGGKAATWLKGFVDFEFYAVIEADDEGNESRVLRTEPSARWSAKQRVPHGAAHLPDPLPLDAQAVAKVMTEAFAPKKKGPFAPKKKGRANVQPVAQSVQERIEGLADSDEAQRLLDAAKARLEEVTDKEKN